jgi:hypothetical protein
MSTWQSRTLGMGICAGSIALLATSRGAQDATGTDEATWARDRRVEVNLAN